MCSQIEHAERAERTRARDEKLEGMIATAYVRATAVSHHLRSVTIRVSPSVFAWMKAKAAKVSDFPTDGPATLWGIPVLEDERWTEDLMSVDTRELIL